MVLVAAGEAACNKCVHVYIGRHNLATWLVGARGKWCLFFSQKEGEKLKK